MIRLVSRARIERLVAEADAARTQARHVREQADTAYSEHIRTVYGLTARAESSEKEGTTLRADLLMMQVALENVADDLDRARDDLDSAREELAARTREVAALKAPPTEVLVLLLHFGEPHSIHPDSAAARAYAATHGAPLNGWVKCDERSAHSVAWLCIPFKFAAGQDHFVSVVAPAVRALEGAG
ncbi:hypothetical protein [Streptomyces sp. NPDC058657]|uniref:hypothetical protein n=1 Tax=unclassified Streptomyces TaxID=2593676 RepID=UPI003659B61C